MKKPTISNSGLKRNVFISFANHLIFGMKYKVYRLKPSNEQLYRDYIKSLLSSNHITKNK